MPARKQARSREDVERAQAEKLDARLLEMAEKALAAFPASVEDWNEKVAEPFARATRELEGAKEIAKRVDEDRAEKFKVSPYAWKTAQKLLRMKSSGDRVHWLIQVLQILKFHGAEMPMDLVERYSQPGNGPVEADAGPVFDNTPTGAKVPKRRGRPPKVKEPPLAAQNAPGIPLDEAERAFEENTHKAPPILPAAVEAPVADSNVVPIKRRSKAAGKGSKVSKRAPYGSKSKTTGQTQAIAERHIAAQNERLGPVDFSQRPRRPMMPPQPEVPEEPGIPEFLRKQGKDHYTPFNPVFDPSLDVSGID